jgi:hypothetical protein
LIVQKRPRQLIAEIFWPFFQALAFIFGATHKIFLSWWLDPWIQRRANQALWDDVQGNLYFLYSKGHPIVEQHPPILPFDYASVRIVLGNVGYCFTRGRGELNVSLSPANDPKDSHEFSIVMAALDGTDVAEQRSANHFSEVAGLLRPRLDALNEAYSEQAYPAFRARLAEGKRTLRILAKEASWELNKRLYPWR